MQLDKSNSHLLIVAGVILIAIAVLVILNLEASPRPLPTETDTPTRQAESTPTRTPTATITPTPPGFDFVTSNADWEPFIQEFNGVEMVLVPAGCFMMGNEEGDLDEQPVHEVCFDEPFWVDVYEVTNGQFGSAALSEDCWEASSEDDQPRVCIDWYDAAFYCESRGARLPTEAEWEYAARGPDRLLYPWGNIFTVEKVVYPGNAPNGTAPVGSKPGGVSWVGAFDLSGNVSEWVSDWYAGDYYGTLSDGVVNPQGPDDEDHHHVTRGGSWHVRDNDLRAPNRNERSPTRWDERGGFRCARSFSPFPEEPVEAPIATAEIEVWEPHIEVFNGVEMAEVPAGCFMMGSDDDREDEQPIHQVCFEESFWIDVYEVTNEQYGSAALSADCQRWSSADTEPRVCVSWFDAVAYCKSRGVRLPTEAEWEYTARGSQGLVYPWGNYFEEAYVNDPSHTEPVGSNENNVSWIGVFDLSAGVAEWVNDWYQEDYYSTLPDGIINPQGPETGEFRVLRGGGTGASARRQRGANRTKGNPEDLYLTGGFRCASDNPPPSEPVPTKTPTPTLPPEPTPTADLAALQLAEAGVSSNDQWTPYIREFDGVPMALVPKGCFLMGSTYAEVEDIIRQCKENNNESQCKTWYGDETPQHTVCFDAPFWIDVYEVTNGLFEPTVQDCAVDSPQDDRPCAGVDWFNAKAFCESRGARLPTEAEWEYTARGPDGLVYPWGNEFDCAKGNFDDDDGCDGFDGAAPVGHYPDDMSWVGVFDLAGNVLEWVNDWHDADYYAVSPAYDPQGPEDGQERSVRGASWWSSGYPLRATQRLLWEPDESNFLVGFRCVRSYEPL